MTTEDALVELGRQTADAIVGVLDLMCPGAASHREPEVTPNGVDAFMDAPSPGLAASVAYVDGVTGGNVFLIGLDGARRLATTMMGGSPDDDVAEDAGPLSELEHSAVAEAMNQMIATAAAAVSTVLGQEVEIAPPELVESGTVDLGASFAGAAHTVTTAFDVCRRPCRLVQLVPQTFVVRMRGALAELPVERPEDAEGDEVARAALHRQLRETNVRLSTEIGRTRLPIERLVDVPAGTVIELDREVHDPVDIYINGHPFALGRLVVNDADEWAVRIERLASDTTTKGR